MSEPTVDARLERELREVLRRRDPGGTPYGLAGRIDRIPDEVPRERGSTAARVLLAAAGLAAAAAAAIAVAGSMAPALPPDATVGGVVATPPPAWEAGITGAGLVAFPDIPTLGLAFAVATLGLLALAVGLAVLRRPRAALAAFAAAVVVPLAVAGLALVPGAAGSERFGASTGPLRPVEMPPGYSGERLSYLVAEPGGLFSTAFAIENGGPLPVHVRGFATNRDSNAIPAWVGVQLLPDWVPPSPGVDRDEAGVAFEPFDLAPGEAVQVRLIGTPGTCAVGEAFDPTDVGAPILYDDIDIVVRYDVLGWPRADRVKLSEQLIVPQWIDCGSRETFDGP